MMMCCSLLFVLLVAVAVIDVCLSVCPLFLFCFVLFSLLLSFSCLDFLLGSVYL